MDEDGVERLNSAPTRMHICGVILKGPETFEEQKYYEIKFGSL
jgi:hypothetical protein